MNKFAHFISFTLASFIALGCGTDPDSRGTTSGGSSNTPTIEQLPALVIKFQCEQAIKCPGAFESVADCEASISADMGEIKAGVDAGTIVYHADKVQACLDAAGMLVNCSHTDQAKNPNFDAPAACNEVFTGAVADKGACKVDEECVSGNCEIVDPASCMDSCCMKACGPKPTPTVPAKIGESCAAPGAECESGAFCQHDANFNPTTCAAQVAAGAACKDYDECIAPAYCSSDPMTGMGTCKVPAAHGAACDVNEFFSACDLYTDRCDSKTMTCVSGALPGEACDGPSACVNYAYCDTTSMKCVKQGLEAAACDSMIDAKVCMGSLDCVNGKCAFPAEMLCP